MLNTELIAMCKILKKKMFGKHPIYYPTPTNLNNNINIIEFMM